MHSCQHHNHFKYSKVCQIDNKLRGSVYFPNFQNHVAVLEFHACRRVLLRSMSTKNDFERIMKSMAKLLQEIGVSQRTFDLNLAKIHGYS